MPFLLLALLLGVLAYLWWQWRFTSLTRECRWREDKKQGTWHCAYCGAETTSNGPPRECLKDQQ